MLVSIIYLIVVRHDGTEFSHSEDLDENLAVYTQSDSRVSRLEQIRAAFVSNRPLKARARAKEKRHRVAIEFRRFCPAAPFCSPKEDFSRRFSSRLFYVTFFFT